MLSLIRATFSAHVCTLSAKSGNIPADGAGRSILGEKFITAHYELVIEPGRTERHYIAAMFMWIGVRQFRKIEKSFADVI